MAKLTKVDAKQVAMARIQLAENPGYYARAISALQRSAARPQAIYDVIREDGTADLFVEERGCLLAAPDLR
jgi:hypothetical protein